MGFVTKLTWRQRAFVRRFEVADLKYFYKVMSKSMLTEVIPGPFAYQMEFPNQFLENYANEFDEHAMLECKSRDPTSTKQWPLGITVRYFRTDKKKRVFAYGKKGWRAFFLENNVQLGDLLVFQLIGYSRFRAYILPRKKSQG